MVETTATTEHNAQQHYGNMNFTSYHNTPTAAEEMVSSNVKNLSLPKNHPKRNNSMNNLADVLLEAKRSETRRTKQNPRLDAQEEETFQLLTEEQDQDNRALGTNTHTDTGDYAGEFSPGGYEGDSGGNSPARSTNSGIH